MTPANVLTLAVVTISAFWSACFLLAIFVIRRRRTARARATKSNELVEIAEYVTLGLLVSLLVKALGVDGFLLLPDLQEGLTAAAESDTLQEVTAQALVNIARRQFTNAIIAIVSLAGVWLLLRLLDRSRSPTKSP